MLQQSPPNKDPALGVSAPPHLRACLNIFDLILLGVGAVIGAGIFILTGITAATKAGPAIVLSFLLSGAACVFSALSYAELATAIGGCGSVYSYAYAAFGTFFAWIIGWDLILEYTLSCAAVSIGWSAYFSNLVKIFAIEIPEKFLLNPWNGGIADLPGFAIAFSIAMLLASGAKQSSRVNAVVVLIKLAVLALFAILVIPYARLENWSDFMPFGWIGAAQGAATIFFAYIGFDALSTTAEEAINPRRDLPRSIIFSLAICTLIYVFISGLLTLVVPYASLNTASPMADVLLRLGYSFGALVVVIGALAGLTTTILVMFYGASRIIFAMARDGLLPASFNKVHPRYKTPHRVILIGGVIIALTAATMPLDKVAEMVNIGTLAAFVVVNLSVITLRYTRPQLPRPFRTPFGIILPLLGTLFCLYLMVNLPWITWMRFIIWMAVGLIIYFVRAYKHKESIP